MRSHSSLLCRSVVLALLQHKHIEVDLTDSRGMTPFMWDAYMGQGETAVAFIGDARIDRAKQSSDGTTAYGWAEYFGHDSIVSLMEVR